LPSLQPVDGSQRLEAEYERLSLLHLRDGDETRAEAFSIAIIAGGGDRSGWGRSDSIDCIG